MNYNTTWIVLGICALIIFTLLILYFKSKGYIAHGKDIINLDEPIYSVKMYNDIIFGIYNNNTIVLYDTDEKMTSKELPVDNLVNLQLVTGPEGTDIVLLNSQGIDSSIIFLSLEMLIKNIVYIPNSPNNLMWLARGQGKWWLGDTLNIIYCFDNEWTFIGVWQIDNIENVYNAEWDQSEKYLHMFSKNAIYIVKLNPDELFGQVVKIKNVGQIKPMTYSDSGKIIGIKNDGKKLKEIDL